MTLWEGVFGLRQVFRRGCPAPHSTATMVLARVSLPHGHMQLCFLKVCINLRGSLSPLLLLPPLCMPLTGQRLACENGAGP